MFMPELCRICNTRRARRHCPGIGGDICSICCGDQREVNISCPLDCEYLREARLHEKTIDLDPKSVPNQDIRLTEQFIQDHNELVVFCGFTIADAALRTPGAVDLDVQNALEALIRTHRTLESGLVYETRAQDRVAASVQELFERSLTEFQDSRSKEQGLSPYRNAELIGALVFLQRSALTHSNGRPKGRAYIDFLRERLRIENAPEPRSVAGSVLVP
jgi:hypothetical protein